MNLEHAVDAAARTHWETWTAHPYPIVHPRRWDHLSDTERDEVRALVRPVVEAAAPWIAQHALRFAADVLHSKDHRHDLHPEPHATGWGQALNEAERDLRNRADEIQAVTR